MTQQHVAFITNADTKHIERANGQSFELYQVHDNLNNIWVVKKPLWDMARTMLGQQATFITRQEQKGNFTNFYADQLLPVGGMTPQGYAHPMDNPQGVSQQQAVAMNAGWDPYTGQQPILPTPPQGQQMPQYVPQGMPLQGAVSPPNGPVATETVYGSSQHDQERSLSINRSVAVKAAAQVCSGDQYVFWTMLNDIMAFLEGGLLPAKIVEAMFAGIAEPSASAEGATPSEDDIPF